ncbi:MAG TPA: DUF4390 domain-containing protein [Vicinamibacterales bacterium]|nr:DUF4390 domain-containing protein [Vicinamibacterales bacterium]
MFCVTFSAIRAMGNTLRRLVRQLLRTSDMRSVRNGVLTFILFAATVSVAAAEGVRIVPLVRDDSVLVSFELTDGYTPAVKDAVHSGLKTTFTYEIELRQHVPAWVDRTIQTSVVTNSVQYDNLTRRAKLTRTVDGMVESTEETEDEAVMRQWMTTFQRMPLFKTAELETNREYYVRVKATARPTNGSMLWPWGSGISGITKFTFLR